MLQIQVIQGDTGLALALYPRESLAPGAYAVLEPATAESLPPAAGVALRWLGATVVQGFEGESGKVVLERSPAGRYSGRVSARARSVVDTQHIALRGSFRDLAPRADTAGCMPVAEDSDADADADTTGVH